MRAPCACKATSPTGGAFELLSTLYILRHDSRTSTPLTVPLAMREMDMRQSKSSYVLTQRVDCPQLFTLRVSPRATGRTCENMLGASLVEIDLSNPKNVKVTPARIAAPSSNQAWELRMTEWLEHTQLLLSGLRKDTEGAMYVTKVRLQMEAAAVALQLLDIAEADSQSQTKPSLRESMRRKKFFSNGMAVSAAANELRLLTSPFDGAVLSLKNSVVSPGSKLPASAAECISVAQEIALFLGIRIKNDIHTLTPAVRSFGLEAAVAELRIRLAYAGFADTLIRRSSWDTVFPSNKLPADVQCVYVCDGFLYAPESNKRLDSVSGEDAPLYTLIRKQPTREKRLVALDLLCRLWNENSQPISAREFEVFLNTQDAQGGQQQAAWIGFSCFGDMRIRGHASHFAQAWSAFAFSDRLFDLAEISQADRANPAFVTKWAQIFQTIKNRPHVVERAFR